MVVDMNRRERYKQVMKELGYKPRRRKDFHQWWESPFIDYDTPRQSYY